MLSSAAPFRSSRGASFTKILKKNFPPSESDPTQSCQAASKPPAPGKKQQTKNKSGEFQNEIGLTLAGLHE